MINTIKRFLKSVMGDPERAQLLLVEKITKGCVEGENLDLLR